jgi:peptidoglycan/LPS O-acetylase OafA/YrhL
MSAVQFRPDIEGLRAVAILLVVGYHAGVPGFRGGYIGVDLFFVVSGFLITSLLVGEIGSHGRVSFTEFYARRARRLLPASVVVIAATLVAGFWLFPPVEQLRYTGTGIAAAAYVSNLWFAKEATNYLSPDSHVNPFLHTWSLSVEEQFYLVWPLLVAYGATRPDHVTRLRRRMFAVLCISLAAALWLTRAQQPLAFFLSPTRAWEFAAGGLASMVTPSPSVRRMMPLVGASGLLISLLFFSDTTPFPGFAAICPVLGTAALLLAPPASLVRDALGLKLLQVVGRISYSWYLWHWPVLILGQAVTSEPSLSARLMLAAVSLALAIITHVLVEAPVRRSALLVPFPRRSLAFTGGLTACALVVAWTVRDTARHSAREDSEQKRFLLASDDVPQVYGRGCHGSVSAVTVTPCEFGDTTARRTLVLFGDSHAAQWLPVFEVLAAERRFRIVTLTKSACPAVAVEPFDATLNRGYTECTVWRQAAFQWMSDHLPSAVVMSSATRYLVSDDGRMVAGSASPEEWVRGLGHSLRRLAAMHVPALLIRDPAAPKFDVPTCLARIGWNPHVFRGGCTFLSQPNIDSVVDAEARIATTASTAYLNLDRIFCSTENLCRTEIDGKVVFRDSHHLTASFVKVLAPVVGSQLDAIGLGRLPKNSDN